MTREELKGIVFKTHSPLTVEEVMFGIDKYVEQIRTEAIEEFAIALKELPQDDRELYKYAIGDEYSFDEYVDWVAEQLKEQNK